MRRTLAVLATLGTLGFLAADAQAARPVALADARTAPTYLRMLAPGETVTKTRQCPRGGFWSDLSAYRWNGSALAAQRWNADGTVTRWGRVTFDGVTWRNGTAVPVLVAGWCE